MRVRFWQRQEAGERVSPPGLWGKKVLGRRHGDSQTRGRSMPDVLHPLFTETGWKRSSAEQLFT